MFANLMHSLEAARPSMFDLCWEIKGDEAHMQENMSFYM